MSLLRANKWLLGFWLFGGRSLGCDVVWKNQWEKCVWIAQGIKWNTSLECLKCALHIHEKQISINFTNRNLFLKKLVEVQYFCPFLWPPSSLFSHFLLFPLPSNDRPVVSVSFSRLVGVGRGGFLKCRVGTFIIIMALKKIHFDLSNHNPKKSTHPKTSTPDPKLNYLLSPKNPVPRPQPKDDLGSGSQYSLPKNASAH